MFKTRIFILLVCEFCLALPNFMFFIDFQSDCIWNYCGLTWKTFLLCLKTKGTLTFTTITFCLINCNAWQGEEGGGPHFAEWFLGSTWKFQLMIINIDGDRWWSSIKIMVVVIINKDYGRWWSRRWELHRVPGVKLRIPGDAKICSQTHQHPARSHISNQLLTWKTKIQKL